MATAPPEVLSPVPKQSRSGLQKFLWHPIFQVGVSVVLSAASQVFFKLGTTGATPSFLGIPGLATWPVLAGIACTLGSLVFWLLSLQAIPLVVAFNLAAATHVLVPLASWIFLGETIPPLRWVGILVVTLGVLIIARPLSKMEERL